MPWITKEGRSVDEARHAAVAAAGLPEDALDVEIVHEGAKGLFGLGGEPAVVRVRPKSEATDVRDAFGGDMRFVPDPNAPAEEAVDEHEDDAPAAARTDDAPDGTTEEERRTLSEQQEKAAELGTEIVRGILERMDLEGDINTRIAGGTVYIEVFGEEMGILIGRSGATLEALQELVRAGIQRRLKTRQAVVVDVEAYWERRRKGQGERSERGGGGGGGERGRRGGRRRGGRRGGGGGGREGGDRGDR